MKKLLLLGFLLVFAAIANAQSYFTRVYHHDTSYTTGYFYGLCSPVQPTADGGYLLGSTIRQPEFDDYNEISYMIKTDATFHPQWSKRKSGNEVHSLASGSLLYAANLIGFDTPAICPYGISVEKLNLDGMPVFNERLCSDSFDIFAFPSAMPDANLRIAGGYRSPKKLYSSFMANIDTNGAVLSADTFSAKGYIVNLFGDTSGNVYPVFGFMSSTQYVIAKIRADRSIAWSQTIAEPYEYEVSSMVSLPNGDIIYGMTYRGLHPDPDGAMLVKFSSTGNLIWQRRIDGLTRINGMKILRSGNILVASAGTSMFTYPLYVDHPMLEIDTAANVLGAKDISPDTTARPYYIGISVPYESIDGDLYFSTVTKDTFSTIVFNTDRFGVAACPTADTFFTTTDTAFFTITPISVAYGPIPVNTTIQLNTDTAVQYPAYTDICSGVTERVVKASAIARPGVVPNPASNTINIVNAVVVQRLELYDVAGRLAMTVNSESIGKEINISSMQNGTYLVRLYNKDGSVSNHKLVILH